MEIVAKKRKDGLTQNLEEHTSAVLEWVVSLMDEKSIEMVSKNTGYPIQKLKDLIFYCAYFHDIGKATLEFKETIEKDEKSYHSLYSGNIVSKINTFSFSEQAHMNMLLLVILTHHGVYNQEGTFRDIKYEKKYLHRFISEAEVFFYNHKTYYEKYRKCSCKYEFEYVVRSKNELDRIINNGLHERDFRQISDFYSLRLLYCYVAGILGAADWLASANFEGNEVQTAFEEVPFKKSVIKSFETAWKEDRKEKGKSYEDIVFVPKSFQEQLSSEKGNVLVEIPTGEGKTEGSILWAVNQLRNKNSKIIYTLPTQTTSNKLFERLKKVFGKATGLVHGSAQVYLEKLFENEDGMISEDLQGEILYSKTFTKPVTVSTIDSLFKYFVNTGRYTIATYNILNSAVIIDEVHSYDFKLLGFMKRFLELAREYEIPVCLMSASIPHKIKEILKIEDYKHITEPKLFETSAISILKTGKEICQDVERIIEEFNSGKNVLVIRNTVDDSVRSFMQLWDLLKGIGRDSDIMLYNSAFKKKHRSKKEKEIDDRFKENRNFILVATQVVEISLDIDFDSMFTDIAPIDALIQRFGRVNRKKNPERLGNVYIYKVENSKPYEKYILDITYDAIQDGIWPINEYILWLDRVYDKVFEYDKTLNELGKFQEGYECFDKIIKELEGISKAKHEYSLRDIDYPKIDCLLLNDYYNGKRNYEDTIGIDMWLHKKSNVYIETSGVKRLWYPVVDLGYNYEVGLIKPKNSTERLFV